MLKGEQVLFNLVVLTYSGDAWYLKMQSHIQKIYLNVSDNTALKIPLIIKGLRATFTRSIWLI